MANQFNPLYAGAGAGLFGLGLLGNVLQSTTNDAAQRENRQALERLRKMRATNGFGLTPVQEQQLQETLVSPVQKAAAEGRLRAEQMAASTQNATGGQLAALRKEQQQAVSQGGQQAALQVRAMDEAKKLEQQQELEQRTQAQASMRADDLQTILRGAAESAAAGGAIAGAPPGTLPRTLTGLAGMPWTAPGGALTQQQQTQLEAMAKSDPAAFQRLLQMAMDLQSQQAAASGPSSSFLGGLRTKG